MRIKRGKSKNITFRTTDAMRELLRAAATESGRSIADEVRYRLEREFWRDEMLGDERRDQSNMMVL